MLVMGSAWLAVSMLGDGPRQVIASRAQDSAVLREAKNALIAHVASEAMQFTENSPGRLPCPEDPSFATDGNADNDGVAATTCALPAVGRLPWKTLGLPKLLDSAGEPLWYVVSAGWALPTAATAISINSNTVGQLTLDGVVPGTPTPSNTVAALIIAPGPPIAVSPNTNQAAAGCTARNQKRSVRSGDPAPDLRDYLECENASSPANATFVTAVVDNANNPAFNDQLVSVSPAEIFDKAEAAIAARIERDVVPHLKAVYSTSQWGQPAEWGLAPMPIFPYAAPFADPGTSAFQGNGSATQGLLPVSRANCNPATDPRCDPAFVRWSTVGITVAQVSGTATISSYSCSTSSASMISCSITYGRSCFFCSATMRVSIQATALNIGNSMRNFPVTTGTSGWSSPTGPSALTIDSAGSVAPSFSGALPTIAGCFITCSTTRMVTIPITVFGDHYFLSPVATDAWWWFFNSNWHQLTYYAVAPNHTPAGATHACSDVATVTCITVNGPSSSTSKPRAILMLAGRTLTGAARPNGTLSDFIDTVSAPSVAGTVNRDLDTVFYKATTSAAYNDRFIVVDANP